RYSSGTGHVPYGPEPYFAIFHYVFMVHVQEFRRSHQLAISGNDVPFVGEINRRQINVLAADVIPHIQFRPVTDGEYAYIFSFMYPSIVDVPQLRSLALGIPLPELIAYRKDTFLRTCLFFIPPRTADAGIKAVF